MLLSRDSDSIKLPVIIGKFFCVYVLILVNSNNVNMLSLFWPFLSSGSCDVRAAIIIGFAVSDVE